LAALYVDTSAVLRAVLETGTSPDVEAQLRAASALLTSRLSLVESARAVHRLRRAARIPEARLADAEREIASLWARCDIWELTAAVCDTAGLVASGMALRALDALHLATFVLARRRIAGLELVTVDDRLRAAADAV
jgi:predicted nucleic acid-binding protein